jgi:predicted nucleic acid-binding protein
MSLVLDASMTIAWQFEDETTETTRGVLQQVAQGGAHVPILWYLEVANGLNIAFRRGRCDQGHVDRSLARLARLPIVADDETGTRAWTSTLELARSESLTLYDASYLELALRLGLPLATGDAKLIASAIRRQVVVLGS